MLRSSCYWPAALHRHPMAACLCTAIAAPSGRQPQRGSRYWRQAADHGAAPLSNSGSRSSSRSSSSSRGTRMHAAPSTSSSSTGAGSATDSADQLIASTRSRHACMPIYNDVPALEELVDPDCVPDFFCGLAAHGNISVCLGHQTRTGMRYTDSRVHVQFGSLNPARLQIISKYLHAAGGPAGRVRARTEISHELAYCGHACQAALQLLLGCPVKGYAASLAMEYLQDSTTQQRRAEIHALMAEYNAEQAKQVKDGHLVSVCNDSVVPGRISAAFIAGYFTSHGHVDITWDCKRQYSALVINLKCTKAPRLLYFMHKFLGYGSLYPARQRILGEKGMYTQLRLTAAVDITSFCNLLDGLETEVGTGTLPATASGLPRCLGQRVKPRVLTTYFAKHGLRLGKSDAGNIVKRFRINQHVKLHDWLAMCTPEYGGAPCPPWEQ